jgi:hypothetical protein
MPIDPTKRRSRSGLILAATLAIGSVALQAFARATGTGTDTGSADSSDAPKEPALPPPSQSVRVGGDQAAQVTFANGEYRSGSCRIPTPLPEGYPPPTPPGAIEVKSYPTVRRAEVDGAMAPDLGMNLTFWPLFQHISRRRIAMTSPVEIDYQGFDPEADGPPQRWTMSFLYRTPDDGPRGVDRSVRIVDAAPLTVVSLGFNGGTSLANVRDHLAILDRWLEAHPEWVRAGEPRALFYNGPEVPERFKWVEAQIPVRPAEKPAPIEAAPPEAPAPAAEDQPPSDNPPGPDE